MNEKETRQPNRKHNFGDLVDVVKIQEMMDLFYELSGAPSGIIDVDNNILVATGRSILIP